MIHRLLFAPAAAFALVGAAPASLYQAPKAQADRVRATVEFLADDLLEGRKAGTRGHEVAALYVASRFRELGLEPAGDQGTWYQRVPFRRAAIEGTPTVSLRRGGRAEALINGKDIAIRPSVTEKERKLSGELVFVGNGLQDARLRLNDYAGQDLHGKIAVVLSGTPKGLASDVSAHLSQQKDEMAAAAGAVGLIEIGSDRPSFRPVTDWVDAAGRAGNTPPGLRLRATFSRAAAERLFASAGKPLPAILAQRAAGRPVAGFSLGASLSVDAKSSWTDFTSPAVIGRLPGSDPKLLGETILLMGHLDHLGLKENAKPGEDNVYNGALDNAAGVATMLEAASRFVTSRDKPKRSLLFIAHTGEELGLLGASYWANHSTVPIGTVTAAVDLDMPVPLYDFSDVVAFGADHSTVAEAVAAAGKSMGIGLGPDPMPEQGIFTRSDHYPLVLKGVPAILLFTGYGSGGKPVWDKFFGNNYHQVSDDLKQPINWGALARYGELNYRIARSLADAPQRSRWYADSYFGQTVAPTQPKAKR